MTDRDKREEVLRSEIESLRQRVEELERREEDRKTAEERLRKTEETLLDLFDATEEVAFLIDREGTILVANRNAARLYGVSVERLPGRSVYDLIPSDRVESSKKKVRTALETRKPVRFEGKLEGKVFENNLYPVLDAGAQVQRVAVYVRDITERKQLEVMLHQTEEKYRNIYENAIEGIFQINPEGRFISANPSLARIHGYDSPEELITSVDDLHRRYVNPEDHIRLINLLFEQGAVQNYEVKMYRKDGNLHWISVNVRLVRDAQGKTLYYEGTMRDISKRKLAEEALAESEERYRAAIEHSNDAVAIIRGDKNQYVNKRFMEIFGYDRPEDILGKSIFLIVHPDDRNKVMTINQRRQRGEPVPSRYEFKGIKKDGEVIYIEVSATSIVYRGMPVYLIYLRDMTERKAAEEALRTERNRFRTLSENAPFGIIMVDGNGVFEYINPKFKELFGYELAEVPNGQEWFKKAFPEQKYREEIISTWKSDQRSTRQGEKRTRTFYVACKDGTQKIIHFIPVRLASGESIVTLEDITERIQAHEALMRSHQELEQLNRAKTKAVNHISHELKTPLAVIQGSLRILRRKLQDSPVAVNLYNLMEAIERNLTRLFDISKKTDEIFRISQELEAGALLDNIDKLWQRIEDLSDIPPSVRSHLDAVKAWLSQYQSGSTESFQTIDLFPFVVDVLERVKQFSRHRNIRFQTDGEKGLFILMDPLLLQNVVEGLVRNAVENTPDGGAIRVRVEEEGERITLHVTDSGVGITADNQAYVFDGLFHTRETDRYTSKKPYDFGAGGKGLDLLRMKVYAQRFGFDLSMTSRRCPFIPTEKDQCPGDISECSHVSNEEECAASGGTTFSVSFPAKKDRRSV